jgi:hypothetical protein
LSLSYLELSFIHSFIHSFIQSVSQSVNQSVSLSVLALSSSHFKSVCRCLSVQVVSCRTLHYVSHNVWAQNRIKSPLSPLHGSSSSSSSWIISFYCLFWLKIFLLLKYYCRMLLLDCYQIKPYLSISSMVFLHLFYLLDFIRKRFLGFADLPSFPRVPTILFRGAVIAQSV